MKRTQILCMLLAAMMLAGTSCGGNTDGDKTNETVANTVDTTTTVEETETESAYTPLPEKDMDGWALRFLNYDEANLTWAENDLIASEMNGDTLNDAIYERNFRIQDTYNCLLQEVAVADPAADLGKQVQAGDASAEVVLMWDQLVLKNYTNGYLLTWDNLPYVDFDAEYWNKSSTETFSNMGKVYAATGDFSLSQNTRSFILLFNKDMYTDLGLEEDLYALAEDGTWTLDKLLTAEEAAVLDLDGDGEMTDKDRYGTAGAIKLYFGSLITGAGVKYIDIDENGEPYFAIPGNEYAISVMSDILAKHNGTNIFHQVQNNVHDGTNEATTLFKNNQILFCGSAMRAVGNFRDMDADIGILPFPKYTEDQDRYYALTSGGAMATLPKTLSETENTGLLLEALSRDSHDGVVSVYKETLLKSRYARDEGSAKMLDIIFDSAVYDLGLSVMPDNTYYAYMDPFMKNSDTFASLTQTLVNKVEADLTSLKEAVEN